MGTPAGGFRAMGYRLAASSSAFLFFILISHTFADPQYIAVDLGIPILPFVPPNFGINDSGQFGINDSGQVVGLNQVNGQAVRTIPNGTFDTADLLPTFGRRINNAGQSAGYTQNPVFVAALNSADNHPSFQQLGTFAGNNQTGSRAFGLNNLPNPQVVGLSYGNGLIFLYHPFLWQNGATN